MEGDLITILVKVKQEKEELDIKIKRLKELLHRKNNPIKDIHRSLLLQQFDIMLRYKAILDIRIEYLKEDINHIK